MVHLLRFNSGLTTYKIVVRVDQLTIQVYGPDYFVRM